MTISTETGILSTRRQPLSHQSRSQELLLHELCTIDDRHAVAVIQFDSSRGIQITRIDTSDASLFWLKFEHVPGVPQFTILLKKIVLLYCCRKLHFTCLNPTKWGHLLKPPVQWML